MSCISKRGYLTVNRRTGIMIDLGVAVFARHFCRSWYKLTYHDGLANENSRIVLSYDPVFNNTG